MVRTISSFSWNSPLPLPCTLLVFSALTLAFLPVFSPQIRDAARGNWHSSSSWVGRRCPSRVHLSRCWTFWRRFTGGTWTRERLWCTAPTAVPGRGRSSSSTLRFDVWPSTATSTCSSAACASPGNAWRWLQRRTNMSSSMRHWLLLRPQFECGSGVTTSTFCLYINFIPFASVMLSILVLSLNWVRSSEIQFYFVEIVLNKKNCKFHFRFAVIKVMSWWCAKMQLYCSWSRTGSVSYILFLICTGLRKKLLFND